MKRLAAMMLMACLSAAQAAELPSASVEEINQLLATLGNSGCRFNRNGSWYSAADAQAHLTKKYEYLRNKEKLASTEDFIAMAGAQSSSSGKAYQVQCGTDAAMPSASWLGNELKKLRTPKPAG